MKISAKISGSKCDSLCSFTKYIEEINMDKPFSNKVCPVFLDKDGSWWTDLNPRPADYKSAALPTELHQQIHFLTIP